MTDAEKERAIEYAKCYAKAGCDENVEIDNTRDVSEAQLGCWVPSWVWVPREEYEDEADEADEA